MSVCIQRSDLKERKITTEVQWTARIEEGDGGCVVNTVVTGNKQLCNNEAWGSMWCGLLTAASMDTCVWKVHVSRCAIYTAPTHRTRTIAQNTKNKYLYNTVAFALWQNLVANTYSKFEKFRNFNLKLKFSICNESYQEPEYHRISSFRLCNYVIFQVFQTNVWHI